MAAGLTVAGWLEEHLQGAPPELRDRTLRFLEAADPGAPLPVRLARAGEAALRTAIGRPGDRAVALDLLAADALVTLALEAQAALDPTRLAQFARELRAAASGGVR